MPTEVILPRVDMDMAEGKVAHWYVRNGDSVTKGQVLFEIETDKATMEVDAPAAGVMHGIRGELGVAFPVGEVLGWILAPGEAPPAAAGPAGAAASVPPPETMPALAAAGGAPREAAAPTAAPGAALLRATPLARSLARERGLNLAEAAGTGPGGRVLARDVQAMAPATAQAALQSTRPDAPASRQGLNLQWLRGGTGVPLMLIHGFGADLGSWRPLLQYLPAGQAVVAVDLPSHGKSALRPFHTLQDAAAQVLARLDAEGIATVHLTGHSLGGGVALAVAQAAPQRVHSLTLLAPAGLGAEINAGFIDGLLGAADEAALKDAMAALFHDAAWLTGSFVATAFAQVGLPERRQALAELAAHLMPRGRQAQLLRGVLESLRVPAQVVWGQQDRIIPARHALDLPAQVGVHWLPGVGHLPQVEAAAWVAALVGLQLRGVAEPA